MRDIPDPVGYRDFATQPDLTFDRLTERIRQCRFPLGVDLFPLPKPGGVRQITWLDPYDDIGLRVVVGRLSAPIRQSINDRLVYSYPLATVGPRWAYTPHRLANMARRARGQELLNMNECTALGTIDVEQYYPSIDLDLLTAELVAIRCPAGSVEALVQTFHALQKLGGSRGIPIGFEGSGMLGNLFLVNADETARSARVGLLRYTDDTWLFLRDEHDWEPALAEYVEHLAQRKLRPNMSKTGLRTKDRDDARAVIVNGLLDSITSGNTRSVSVEEARELLEIELAEDEPDEVVIRFALGSHRAARDGGAVELLVDHPELFHGCPKAVGDYLVVLAKDPICQRSIDRDWLAEVAARPGPPRQLAARLQACRVASHLHASKRIGQQYFELATSDDGGRTQIPLRTWAACAFAHSEYWKPGRAAEAARDEGTLSMRRGFVLGFAHRNSSRIGNRVFDHLGRVEPDLAPTLAFASGP